MAATAANVAKNIVFHKLKFVKDQEQLDDLSSKKTIGNRVMEALGVSANVQERWWETYKERVYAAFNSQRSCCTTYVKKTFYGQLHAAFGTSISVDFILFIFFLWY